MPVTENQPELEIAFVCDPDMPELDKFHVHVPCFAAREFERDKVTR